MSLGWVVAQLVGSATVSAFLDDDANAAPTDISSADYLDACGLSHSVTVPVLDGRSTLVEFPLVQSCE